MYVRVTIVEVSTYMLRRRIFLTLLCLLADELVQLAGEDLALDQAADFLALFARSMGWGLCF